MKAWDARQRVIANGPFGRPLVLLDGLNGRRTILDPSHLFGAGDRRRGRKRHHAN